MAVGDAYLTWVLDQLSPVSGVTWKRMFGGVALYAGGAIFAVMDNDQVFFRVDDATRPRYLAAGARPWEPMPGREKPSQGYYEVPAELLEDRETVVEWARESVEVAARAASRKKKPARAAAKKKGSRAVKSKPSRRRPRKAK